MPQDLSGRTLGQYELRERLGRGGMADVYKAFQPGMDRFVAVKVMLGHLATDPEFIERFRREARAVGTLRHPNIVNVFDFGIEDDIYYMVMEFIKGENLKAYIAKHPGGLPFDDALRITSQMADALSYAHKAGMIHRDVKPANIMFVDESHEQAILTDFGIAHILSQPGLTASGAMVGTPAYLSPDAAFGRQVDERSDIYGLGIILYEMLTGKVPFEADTPMAIIMKHVNAPLPTRSEYGRDLPLDVEAIILKALMKEADDRYQSADAMKAAVEAARAELAREDAGRDTVRIPKEETPPQPTQQQVETVIMPPEKNASAPSASRLLMQLGGVGIVLVIVLLVIVSALSNRNKTQTDLPTSTVVAEAATEIPATEIPPTDIPATDIPATSIPPTDLPGSDVPATEIAATEAPSVEIASLPLSGGDVDPVMLSGLSPLQDEVDSLLLKDQTDEVQNLIDSHLADDPNDVEALTAGSLAATWDGDSDTALADAQAAIDQGPDSPLGYIALSEANLNWSTDDAQAGLDAAQKALELDPGNPEALWRIAQANYELDNEGAARIALQRAEANGAKGFRFANFAGTMLYDQNLYERAAPYLVTWYRAEPDTYSMSLAAGALIQLDHPAAAYQLVKAYPRELVQADENWTAAYVAYAAGDYAQAREWAETARALSDEAYPATYILALISWYGDGDLDAAMNYFDELEGVDYYDELISPTYGHELYIDRGRILAAAGHHREAIESYQQSFDVNGEFAGGYMLMADSYLALGDPQTALAKLRFALDLTDDSAQQRRLLARIRELAGS